jgi:AcrR family transcriptional regulator
MHERKTRESTEVKRDVILSEGLKFAIENGWDNLTRDAFCTHMGIAAGSVNYHFGDMAGFRRAIMRKAVAKREVAIVADGIASKCKEARNAPESLKKLAIAHMMMN